MSHCFSSHSCLILWYNPRVKLHYMKEQLLHQVLHSTLILHSIVDWAWQQLSLTLVGGGERGEKVLSILGIENVILPLASNTPEVCLIVVRWYRQWWGYFPVAEGESVCTD